MTAHLLSTQSRCNDHGGNGFSDALQFESRRCTLVFLQAGPLQSAANHHQLDFLRYAELTQQFPGHSAAVVLVGGCQGIKRWLLG